MKNLKLTSLFLFIIAFAALYTAGCGDDSTTNNNNQGGSAPNLNMKVGSLYGFTNDSLDTNGITVRPTRLRTIQNYVAQGTFFGQADAFQIHSETRDTVANPQIIVSTSDFYVAYSGGKFYQYGLKKIIDTTQASTWDLVADFNQSFGTQWDIGTITTTIGGFAVTTAIKGKIAEQLTFQTNNTNQNVNAYRVEITGDASTLGFNIGTIYVDYYIGYADPASNPSGLVRLKLRPVWLKLPPPVNTTIFRSPGVDQKISYYVIP